MFTYAQLVSALQAWPEDDSPEFVTNLPRIIALAETRLARDLNLELFDETVELTLTIGSRLLAKPEGWVNTRTLIIEVDGDQRALERRSFEWCINYAPSISEQRLPAFFSELNDSQWLVVDTPDNAYPVVARYIARPTGLSSSNATTYFSRNHGDVLFAACLIEAEQFIKGDERMATMKAKYDELLGVARLECRDLIRADYEPIKSVARTV